MIKKIATILIVLSFIPSLCFGATRLEEEGSLLGYINALDFVGSDITATRSGIKGTITVDITTTGDITYLKIDTSNDPITGALTTSHGSILADDTASGVITLGGIGGSNNEDWSIDLESIDNKISWGSNTNAIILNNLGLVQANDKPIYFGNETESALMWTTTGNDTMQWGTMLNAATSSGYFAFMEYADMGHANRSPTAVTTHPTIIGYSEDEAQALDHWKLYHDATDSILYSAAGDWSITAAGGDINFGDENLNTEGVVTVNNDSGYVILGSMASGYGAISLRSTLTDTNYFVTADASNVYINAPTGDDFLFRLNNSTAVLQMDNTLATFAGRITCLDFEYDSTRTDFLVKNDILIEDVNPGWWLIFKDTGYLAEGGAFGWHYHPGEVYPMGLWRGTEDGSGIKLSPDKPAIGVEDDITPVVLFPYGIKFPDGAAKYGVIDFTALDTAGNWTGITFYGADGFDGSSDIWIECNDQNSWTADGTFQTGDATSWLFYTPVVSPAEVYLYGETVLKFEGASDNLNETTISVTDPTADRAWTIGDVNADFTHTTEDDVLTYNAATRTWAGEAAGGGAVTEIWDDDADTGIQTEESADEDIIRFDIAGTEQIRLEDGKLMPTTDEDIIIGFSATVADVEQLEENSQEDFGGTHWESQSFITGGSQTQIAEVQAKLFKSFGTATEDVSCDIYVSLSGADDDKPDIVGGTLGTSTISAFSDASPGEFKSFVFSPVVSVSSSTKYCAVITSITAPTNRYAWREKNANPYTDGKGGSSTDSGGSWTVSSAFDKTFKIFATVSVTAKYYSDFYIANNIYLKNAVQVQGNYLHIGDGGTVNYADGDGDLYVEDELEIDGSVYIATTLNMGISSVLITNTFIKVFDGRAYAFGAGVDAQMHWDTSGNDFLSIRTKVNDATYSGNIIINEEGNPPDFGQPLVLDPHLRIQSSDATSGNDFIQFWHDQTDGNIEVGAGDLKLTPPASQAVVIANGLVIPSGTAPSPAVVGAMFLDTDESANGSLMMYGNGAWRKVMDLP